MISLIYLLMIFAEEINILTFLGDQKIRFLGGKLLDKKVKFIYKAVSLSPDTFLFQNLFKS